jgi:hypothetical protein
MDGRGSFSRYGGFDDGGRTQHDASSLRRRTFLLAVAGLLVLRSIPAFAATLEHYGRGYSGGYR